MKRPVAKMMLLVGALAFSAPALAQDYPSKPIRLISPASVGTVTDTMLRVYTAQLGARLDWTVVIESRPGGDNFPSTLALLQAPADGYAMYAMPAGPTILPATRKDVPWDLQKDLVPVSRIVNIPILLGVHASVPAKTLPEFVAYAKANPGKLSYGGVGNVSPTTLSFEFLKSTYGLDVVLAIYKDGNLMMPDLAAGRLQAAVNLAGSFMGPIQDGKVRPLALFAGRRSPSLPQVPTAAEATGNPEMNITSWQGFVVRAGTPKPIVDRLEREILAVSRLPEVEARLVQLGYEPLAEDAATFAKKIETDLRRFEKIIRDAKINVK